MDIFFKIAALTGQQLDEFLNKLEDSDRNNEKIVNAIANRIKIINAADTKSKYELVNLAGKKLTVIKSEPQVASAAQSASIIPNQQSNANTAATTTAAASAAASANSHASQIEAQKKSTVASAVSTKSSVANASVPQKITTAATAVPSKPVANSSEAHKKTAAAQPQETSYDEFYATIVSLQISEGHKNKTQLRDLAEKIILSSLLLDQKKTLLKEMFKNEETSRKLLNAIAPPPISDLEYAELLQANENTQSAVVVDFADFDDRSSESHQDMLRVMAGLPLHSARISSASRLANQPVAAEDDYDEAHSKLIAAAKNSSHPAKKPVDPKIEKSQKAQINLLAASNADQMANIWFENKNHLFI